MHSDPQTRWKWFTAHEELKDRALESARLKPYLVRMKLNGHSALVTEAQFDQLGPAAKKLADAVDERGTALGAASRDIVQLLLFWSIDECRSDEGPDWIIGFLSRAVDAMDTEIPGPPVSPRWRAMADELAKAPSFNDRQQAYYNEAREAAAYFCDKLGCSQNGDSEGRQKLKQHITHYLEGSRKGNLMDGVKYALVTEVGILDKYCKMQAHKL